MARSVVGLDIGSTGVRAVGTAPSRSGPSVSSIGTAPIRVGAVVEGEVVDPAATAEAIRAAVPSSLSGRDAVIGLSGRHVIVRQLDLPWMEEALFRKALPYRVAGRLPMPVDDAVLDYVVVGPSPQTEGAGMVRILLVAATRDAVTRAAQAVRMAGLRPVRVDLSGLALLRVGDLEDLPEAVAESRIDIGAEVTTMIVAVAGVPRFVRVLAGEGGAKVTRALAERLSLSPADAEAVKRRLGISAPGRPEPSVADGPAQMIIDRVTDGTITAIRGSLDYFLANAPGVDGLGRVVLSGGGAQLPGLVERLSADLGIPTILVDPFAGTRPGRQSDTAGPVAVLATATGLSLAGVA